MEAQRVGRYVGWVIGLGALLVALVIFLPPLMEKIKQGAGGGSLIERELAKVPSGYYSVNRFPEYRVRERKTDIIRFEVIPGTRSLPPEVNPYPRDIS